MKNSPTAVVTDAIDVLKKAQQAVVDAESSHTQHSARLDVLLLNGDLNDAAVLSEIGKLNIFVSVYPRRSVLQQEAIVAADTAARAVVEEFKAKVMIPRARALRDRVQKKVESDLRPHYRDKDALAHAVSSSHSMREVELLAPALGTYASDSIQIKARNLLTNWDRIEALENTLS
jgi:hypothetical protein